jgi:hypothetical protein
MGLPSRSDNDRQAAEEFEVLIVFWPGLRKARLFFRMLSESNFIGCAPSKVYSIRANPLKNGGAKLRVYDWFSQL